MRICGKKISIKKCVKLYEDKRENPFYIRDSKREDRTNFSQLERNVYSDRAKEMWKSGILKKYSYTLISLDDKNEIKTELTLKEITNLLGYSKGRGVACQKTYPDLVHDKGNKNLYKIIINKK